MAKTILKEGFERVDALGDWLPHGVYDGWVVERTTESPISGLASCKLTSPAIPYSSAGINRYLPLVYSKVGCELDFILPEGRVLIELALEIQTGDTWVQSSINWAYDPPEKVGVWQIYRDGAWVPVREMPLTRGVKHHLKVVIDHVNEKYCYLVIDGQYIDLRQYVFNKAPNVDVAGYAPAILMWSQQEAVETSVLIDNIVLTKDEAETPQLGALGLVLTILALLGIVWMVRGEK